MTTETRTPQTEITGVILAGGRARRMGGVDKGLVTLDGTPMVRHIQARLAPQVGPLLINANRNPERYASLSGLEVVADDVDGYAGPLAGMAAALGRSTTRYLLTVPCDSPFVAPDLAARLYAALRRRGSVLSVAHDGRRLQPVFALLETRLRGSLLEYLASGERKIDRWYALHDPAVCDLSDRADMFLNINTPEEREALEARVKERMA